MNLRETKVYDSIIHHSPVKESIVAGTNLLIVRELTSGIYFGRKEERVTDGEREYADEEAYRESEIRRIARKAFELARRRRGKVTLVGKSNVLKSSVLWREVTMEAARDFPDVACGYMHVDNAAMQLILNPRQFDVILTSNLFGDILSGEASVLTGSIGLLPSASLGELTFGLYEPIHGSAPDIAGRNIANPISAILSVALMLRYTFGKEEQALEIERAGERVLERGYRTADLAQGSKDLVQGGSNIEVVGTDRMGDLIAACILGGDV